MTSDEDRDGPQDASSSQRGPLPLDEDQLASPDVIHLAPSRRYVRITIDPIASTFLEFYRQGNPPDGPGKYRNVEMRSIDVSSEQPMSFTLLRCEKSDPANYVGRALIEVRPLGAVVGTLTITGTVDDLVAGDLIGYAYTRDDVVGGTIKVEVYRNNWDTIVNDHMTKSKKMTTLNF